MGPPSYMRSVVDRNVVMRRMTVFLISERIPFFSKTHAAAPTWISFRKSVWSNIKDNISLLFAVDGEHRGAFQDPQQVAERCSKHTTSLTHTSIVCRFKLTGSWPPWYWCCSGNQYWCYWSDKYLQTVRPATLTIVWAQCCRATERTLRPSPVSTSKQFADSCRFA